MQFVGCSATINSLDSSLKGVGVVPLLNTQATQIARFAKHFFTDCNLVRIPDSHELS